MEQIIDPEKVVTLSEAAQILGVTVYQLRYVLTSGKARDVRQFGKRRVFSADDLQRIRKVLKGVYGPRRNNYRPRMQQFAEAGG